jgi:hypothetical protein
MNDFIRLAYASGHVPAALEPAGSWSRGKCLLWDATCSDTLEKSYISSKSRSAGAAALNTQKRKHKKYEALWLTCTGSFLSPWRP